MSSSEDETGVKLIIIIICYTLNVVLFYITTNVVYIFYVCCKFVEILNADLNAHISISPSLPIANFTPLRPLCSNSLMISWRPLTLVKLHIYTLLFRGNDSQRIAILTYMDLPLTHN